MVVRIVKRINEYDDAKYFEYHPGHNFRLILHFDTGKY